MCTRDVDKQVQIQRDVYMEMEKYIEERPVDTTERETGTVRCRNGNGHVWREPKGIYKHVEMDGETDIHMKSEIWREGERKRYRKPGLTFPGTYRSTRKAPRSKCS